MIPNMRHNPRCVLENTAQYPVLLNIIAVFIIIVTVMLRCYENVTVSIDGAGLELFLRSRYVRFVHDLDMSTILKRSWSLQVGAIY